MNNIYFFLYLLLCPLVAGAGSWEQAKLAESEVQRLKNTKLSQVTENSLPVGSEHAVIMELRKKRAYRLLLRLNDQKTIDYVMTRFMANRGQSSRLRDIVSSSRSPWVLDDLGPLLYEDDSFEARRWAEGSMVHRDFGYSLSVAQIMACIIMQSPEVSDAVRSSAKALPGLDIHSLNPSLLDTMRGWWNDNKELVIDERFDELSPIVPAYSVRASKAVVSNKMLDDEESATHVNKGSCIIDARTEKASLQTTVATTNSKNAKLFGSSLIFVEMFRN